MLVASIRNLADVEQALPLSDVIELRLDLFPSIDLEAIEAIVQQTTSLFTVHHHSDEILIAQLFHLKPHFFDLDYRTPPSFLQRMSHLHPDVKIILSYHNWEETPVDLLHLLSTMQSPYAYAYKIATTANSILDSLRMLHFLKEHAEQHRLIGLCMGEKGEITRILSPIFGSMMTYGAINSHSTTASGQLTLLDMIALYHHRSLNHETRIYGLIGHPILYSKGHLVHNAAMKDLSYNGVYVKMAVLADELPEVLRYARILGIRGLSVTMPLKEAVLSYLDAIEPQAEKMGAVNTLTIDDQEISGFNTDGPAAVAVLEKITSLQDKKVVILGAGGVAKAIAYSLSQRGARLLIFNRTARHAQLLAQQVGGDGFELDQLDSVLTQQGFDILIHCSPQDPVIEAHHFDPSSIVMDVRMHSTVFLQQAAKQGAQIVHGHALFIEQAIYQEEIWFNRSK